MPVISENSQGHKMPHEILEVQSQVKHQTLSWYMVSIPVDPLIKLALTILGPAACRRCLEGHQAPWHLLCAVAVASVHGGCVFIGRNRWSHTAATRQNGKKTLSFAKTAVRKNFMYLVSLDALLGSLRLKILKV